MSRSFDWETWEDSHRCFPDRERVVEILLEAKYLLPAGKIYREVATLLEHNAIASALDSFYGLADTAAPLDPRVEPLLLAAARLMGLEDEP